MTISFKKITKPTNLVYFQHIIAYPKLVVFLWSSESCTTSRPSVSMHVSPQNVRFVFNISLRNQLQTELLSFGTDLFCDCERSPFSQRCGSHSLLLFE